MSVQTMEFEKRTIWIDGRDSLKIFATDGERRITFVLPYEVACDGRLDGRDREENTTAYFVANREHVEAVAARSAGRHPNVEEIIIRQV